MSGGPHILAIDQGTTSTRAVLYDADGAPVATAQRELPQIFPGDGWVEHDPDEIWAATIEVSAKAVGALEGGAAEIAALGITNQRETTLIWERDTGRPIHNAIVWQDRRTAEACARLKGAAAEAIAAKTGLIVDPYFSATKIAWLLDNVDGARARAAAGELAFGTVDTFLLWRLTGGAVHTTDATNAARTMLFDIHRQAWDEDLLELLEVPAALLPDVRDTAGDFGTTDPQLFGAAIPITGMAGDQQAGLVGQACFQPGMIKSTYGTGCFAVLNTGAEAMRSGNQLLTTVAYRIGGEVTYALEGSIFIAGAAVQWLRDGLKIIASTPESERFAVETEHTGGVYMVPAFTGLGAPHWDPDARGAIVGLTRDSGIPEIVRATLESVCYQTRDLFEAMAADGVTPAAVRADGGMAANDWVMQFLADMLDIAVERPADTETTVLGAAYLAGLGAGLYGSLDEVAEKWRLQQRFTPAMDTDQRAALYAGWQDAVARVRGNP